MSAVSRTFSISSTTRVELLAAGEELAEARDEAGRARAREAGRQRGGVLALRARARRGGGAGAGNGMTCAGGRSLGLGCRRLAGVASRRGGVRRRLGRRRAAAAALAARSARPAARAPLGPRPPRPRLAPRVLGARAASSRAARRRARSPTSSIWRRRAARARRTNRKPSTPVTPTPPTTREQLVELGGVDRQLTGPSGVGHYHQTWRLSPERGACATIADGEFASASRRTRATLFTERGRGCYKETLP